MDQAIQDLRKRVVIFGESVSKEVRLPQTGMIVVIHRPCAISGKLLIHACGEGGMFDVHQEHTAGPQRFMNAAVDEIQLLHIMPCGSTRNEVAILYGDFSQVEVLQQGTDPVQEHECITFPGTVEVSMDGYAQVRLLDRQAVKGLRVTG